MSYEIEVKKRKFDQLLDSLNEATSGAAQKPPVSFKPLHTKNRLNTTLSTWSSLKRRKFGETIKTSSTASLRDLYLPTSREAFLQRLATYRSVTQWRIPSTTPINAAEWAKRGWICVGEDTVSCGGCHERLVVDLQLESPATSGLHQSDSVQTEDVKISDSKHDTCENDQTRIEEEEEEEEVQMQIYNGLVERYRIMITTAHTETCLWRKKGCDQTIQRIEGLLSNVTAITSLKDRYNSMASNGISASEVADLPAYENLPPPKDEDFVDLDFLAADDGTINLIKLAMGGWYYKDVDMVECKHCFRSLGLWLYRGDQPTVEHLNVIESHLQYCPWRNAEAQDTEIVAYLDPASSVANKLKFPGWALVYHAIRKESNKKRGRALSAGAVTTTTTDSIQNPLTPDQRQARAKDLTRRTKEVRKLFSIKGMLRRNIEKATT